MPGWGGSNTACENAGQWAPVFELLGALYNDSQMRYGAARLFAVANRTKQADPITFMLAHELLDAEVPVVPKTYTAPMVGFRRSPGMGANAEKQGDEYARLVAEKLVLTSNDSQVMLLTLLMLVMLLRALRALAALVLCPPDQQRLADWLRIKRRR